MMEDYLVLAAVFISGIATFFFFGQTLIVRKAIVCFLVAVYVLWGVIHHYQKGDLHFRVVLEYFLIALIALMVCFSLFSLL
jgi:hypothetical protein